VTDLIPIGGNIAVMRARITDEELDKPIRRIFPLWLLHRSLRLKQIALVPPRMWEDPHEDPASLCVLHALPGVKSAGTQIQQSLTDFLAPAWAQCWSLNPGSDTLMRAYSRVILDSLESRNTDPRNEGVSVTSTPRLLFSAMKSWADSRPDSHFVLGRVRYLSEDAIGQFLVNVVNSDAGPQFFRTVQGRGESLLMKRELFQHEDEVRLICIQRDVVAGASDVRTFSIDPNELFTSISFDPRLVEFERKEREAEVRRLGYDGRVKPDLSYSKLARQLMMQKDWPAN